MKKNSLNFWVDIIIFLNFVFVIFSGVLLHRFPPELKGHMVLGVNRYDWADLHWVLTLLLITLVIAHLVLHWAWAKGSLRRHLKVEAKLVVIALAVMTVFLGLAAPVFLTDDFPHRKAFKASYSQDAISLIVADEAEGRSAGK